LYVQAAENYVQLHLKNSRHLLHVPIATLEASLDPEMFLRIHRSLVVNVRHVHELECAKRIAAGAGVARHTVVTIDLAAFGGSALTDDAIAVPKNRPLDAMGEGIPVTYVPARNTIFLSFALAWAETLGSQDIFIGVNALDYSGYPACRPEFIDGSDNICASTPSLRRSPPE